MSRFWYIFLLSGFIATAQSDVAAVDAMDAVVTDSTATYYARDTVSTKAVPVHFRKNFETRYTSNDFNYETKVIKKSWWEKFKERLGRFFDDLFSTDSGKDGPSVTNIIVWTIMVLAVIAVIYFIVRALLDREGGWIFGRNSDRNIVRYEDVAADLKHADFGQMVAEATAAGDQRLAIRYYYLWLLKELTRRNVIEWDIEKTNSDYEREIGDEQLRARFTYLSYLYNNIWYGVFELDTPTFEKTRKAFELTIKTGKS